MRGQKMLAKPTETALSTELAEAVDRARDFAKASKAHATRKAYAADLRDFAAYWLKMPNAPKWSKFRRVLFPTTKSARTGQHF